MFSWGNTVNGELGLGGIEDNHILSPTEITNFKDVCNIKSVACGKNHTLALTEDGKLYSCGSNDFGQLGHNGPRTKLRINLISEQISNVDSLVMTNVACGEAHSMALNEWGQLYTWGSDSHCQLGRETADEIQLKPKIVKSLGSVFIVQISCGYRHCLALTNHGELYSWGSNEFGQLGLGSNITSINVSKPTLIKSLIGLPISFITCGGYHSFVISKSGAVYGWGKNTFGQLGLNNEINMSVPVQLKTLRSIKVKYIAAGEDFSVFLTQDGGVFTCGAGMYGQLGHGSFSNEIVPKKILELMGSTVTQVSCGRRHTLTLVPSKGRVYSFGLGGVGQLGTKVSLNSNTPQLVLGPWLSPFGTSIIETNKQYIVKSIYAGGDQCFVKVTNKMEDIPSDDYRILQPNSQIWTVKLSDVLNLSTIQPDVPVDQERMLFVEIVMSSLSCLNGSFLLLYDKHYCCTINNSGIDLELASQCFDVISHVHNTSLSDLILTSIASAVDSLSISPPDLETLRFYLTLPLYHEFKNTTNASILQIPYAEALLCQKPLELEALDMWIVGMPIKYFDNLISIFKNLLIDQLNSNTNPLNTNWDKALVLSASLLAKLNKLNSNLNGHQVKKGQLKVPYTTFYIPQLADKIDIQNDYMRWTHADINGFKDHGFYFCNYAFLFDAEAKTILLQIDQRLQMQQAMHAAATRAFTQMLFLDGSNNSLNQFIELTVSRNNLVEDAIHELSQYTEHDYKKPLKVKFIDEEAEDAGGVKKEFFMLLIKEILDPKYGMFINSNETNMIWFNDYSFEDLTMYYLVGLMCGLAIYNFIILDLPFPLVLYKKLLNEPITLQDLKDLQPTMVKSFEELLAYNQPDLAEIFNLTFEITREVYGEIQTVPLKPNGSNIEVTQENKHEFVHLYVDMILNQGVEKQFKVFKDAFFKVCGGRVLRLFHSQELMAVVVGNQDYDWHELEKNAQYKNGYTADDPTIKLFWEVFHELEIEHKKKFLLFLTGTDRVPVMGMKAIKIYIQPTQDDNFLPVAHTCFNLLDLPKYQSKGKLKYKLTQAIHQTQGFSLV
ncbi:probable E3 ubiquitin-protein ligase HERC4 isoform X1 [Daktulosphaira vitifoliae]|uniref:probable E3 ubiquitin-protein ligase HERC4 isoform X1 n=1 Tax=Daktulosphaira vitifoliae TaxID=58002 RepID=UPI0021AA43A5|nr:probable E3 ubiquitin-protein ligase HERC4 isoform X1 [Daktulosphaira vitifoliae]